MKNQTLDKQYHVPQTKKIQVTFTVQQVDMIDKVKAAGRLGHQRADVIKQIVLLYLNEEEKKRGL
jgi:hypothetical protein